MTHMLLQEYSRFGRQHANRHAASSDQLWRLQEYAETFVKAKRVAPEAR